MTITLRQILAIREQEYLRISKQATVPQSPEHVSFHSVQSSIGTPGTVEVAVSSKEKFWQSTLLHAETELRIVRVISHLLPSSKQLEENKAQLSRLQLVHKQSGLFLLKKNKQISQSEEGALEGARYQRLDEILREHYILLQGESQIKIAEILKNPTWGPSWKRKIAAEERWSACVEDAKKQLAKIQKNEGCARGECVDRSSMTSTDFKYLEDLQLGIKEFLGSFQETFRSIEKTRLETREVLEKKATTLEGLNADRTKYAPETMFFRALTTRVRKVTAEIESLKLELIKLEEERVNSTEDLHLLEEFFQQLLLDQGFLV
ncbi:MAG: hypothetical protein KGZ39_06465 [Simkania sp.]|nr:hypothetical protein [Simkania sp.]